MKYCKDQEMLFNPSTGEPSPYTKYADEFRTYHCSAWLYNPWTGKKRDPRDIASDVFGRGISMPKQALPADAITFNMSVDDVQDWFKYFPEYEFDILEFRLGDKPTTTFTKRKREFGFVLKRVGGGCVWYDTH